MALKSILIFALLIFFVSFVSAVTVTDITNKEVSTQQAQSFAQMNAKIVELSNQVQALRVQNASDFNSVLRVSDLGFVFNNIDNIQKKANLDVLTSNIILVVLAFCVMFILIGKNLLPVHSKEDRESKEKENKRLLAENEALKRKLEQLTISAKGKSWGSWFSKNRLKSNPPHASTIETELKGESK